MLTSVGFSGELRSGLALQWKTPPPCHQDSIPVRNTGHYGVLSPELRSGLC